MLISYSEFERLSGVPSLGWLLTNSPLDEGDLPDRRAARALRESEFWRLYLLDSNVVSHMAPTGRKINADLQLAEWIQSRSGGSVAIGDRAAEIEDGIAKAARKGATRKAADQVLKMWPSLQRAN